MLTLDENHIYRWNGSIVPGVTEILTSLGLIDSRFFNEQSMERGRIVHQCLALLLKDNLDWATVDPRLLGYVKAGEKAIQELKIKPKLVERPLYHDQLKYAGTADILEEDDILDDWKTGIMLKAYHLQAGAYKLLLEQNKYLVKQSRIIQLFENGNYKPHSVDIRAGRDWVVTLSYCNLKLNYGV